MEEQIDWIQDIEDDYYANVLDHGTPDDSGDEGWHTNDDQLAEVYYFDQVVDDAVDWIFGTVQDSDGLNMRGDESTRYLEDIMWLQQYKTESPVDSFGDKRCFVYMYGWGSVRDEGQRVHYYIACNKAFEPFGGEIPYNMSLGEAMAHWCQVYGMYGMEGSFTKFKHTEDDCGHYFCTTVDADILSTKLKSSSLYRERRPVRTDFESHQLSLLLPYSQLCWRAMKGRHSLMNQNLIVSRIPFNISTTVMRLWPTLGYEPVYNDCDKYRMTYVMLKVIQGDDRDVDLGRHKQMLLQARYYLFQVRHILTSLTNNDCAYEIIGHMFCYRRLSYVDTDLFADENYIQYWDDMLERVKGLVTAIPRRFYPEMIQKYKELFVAQQSDSEPME